MKISELVKQLKAIQDKHGDKSVAAFLINEGIINNITAIEFIEFDEDDNNGERYCSEFGEVLICTSNRF